jgi:hypothetical protein
MESLPEDTCMVAGRPGCAKSIPVFTTHNCINSLDSSPSSLKSSLPRQLRSDCIAGIKLIDLFVVSSLEPLHMGYHLLNVIVIVNFEDIHEPASV